MATRIADSLKQQNDLKTFPVAFSEDIWLDQNKGEGDADYKDLQTLFNENKLGGSGLPEPESADKLLLSAASNTRAEGLEWKQVDKSTVGDVPFKGTEEEWKALPDDEKAKFQTVIFTDGDDTAKGYLKGELVGTSLYITII